MKSCMEPKAGRGGRALLSGILRCRRCGRMVHVSYGGVRRAVVRYHCRGAHLNHGEGRCISFGALRVDETVAREVLGAISGNAVKAALDAAEQLRRQQEEQKNVVRLEVEQAQYEARVAARRYEACDPENRLVAAELEVRWNAALEKVRELKERLEKFDLENRTTPVPDQAVLMSLAQDLPAVWNSPAADMRLKQRIIHILVEEIVADVDEDNQEIVLLVRWAGGRHSELRVKKNGSGKHRRCTSLEAIEVIRQMAATFPDEQIASTLNRLGLRTGSGNNWTESRVCWARRYHQLSVFDPAQRAQEVTLEESAHRLGMSASSVRRMIEQKKLPAHQVVPCSPCQIPGEALDSELVRRTVINIKNRVRAPRTLDAVEQQAMFSEV